jgi:hypothetical protein
MPPPSPSSSKKTPAGKKIINVTPLSTPTTTKKILQSKDTSNTKTPLSSKRTQTDRDITSSDEKRELEGQPPTKKLDHKYKEHIHVGHLNGSADVKVVSNTNGEHVT